MYTNCLDPHPDPDPESGSVFEIPDPLDQNPDPHQFRIRIKIRWIHITAPDILGGKKWGTCPLKKRGMSPTVPFFDALLYISRLLFFTYSPFLCSKLRSKNDLDHMDMYLCVLGSRKKILMAVPLGPFPPPPRLMAVGFLCISLFFKIAEIGQFFFLPPILG